MHKLLIIIAASALLGSAALPAAAATAPPVNKTWVSSTGVDSGSCQLVAPCKTFAYAISETNAGGEIDVKDSGAYGAFVINKSIAIVADGVVASVGLGTNSHGIDIESGPNDVVSIRGLTINVHNLGDVDIYVNALSKIIIDHDIVQGAYIGINLEMPGTIICTNSLISGNSVGIYNIGNGNIYIGYDVITGNSFGTEGSIMSYGNNSVNANATADFGSGTIIKVSPE